MNSKINIWHPFSRETYYYEWRESYIFGVMRQLWTDIKYTYQRARYGYCDQDLWSIDYWFLDVMPRMLEEHKLTRYGSPVVNESDIGNDEALTRAWDEILDRMIFLFREASEQTCTRTNPYEEEYTRANDEFRELYGHLGEKLMTDEEKEDARNGRGWRVHFADELPEYQDIHRKYFDEDKKITAYREQCKDEAFELFTKWFYHLWD